MAETRDPRLKRLHRLWLKAMRIMPCSQRQRDFVEQHNRLHDELTADGIMPQFPRLPVAQGKAK